VAAGAFGFLTLIHALDGPERYGTLSFFEKMPSRPSLQMGFEHFVAVAFGVLDVLNAAPGTVSRANQRCPVEGGGGGTVDDCPVGCGGLRGGTARD
jgi:hypothetical protein